MDNFVKIIEPIQFRTLLRTLPTKGKLVYEYNPLRNYRFIEDKYLYDGKYYTEQLLLDSEGPGLTRVPNEGKLEGFEKDGKKVQVELRLKGLLVDFITDLLNFSLEHPVHIVPLYSYDGSVNLIINDGLNIPRLINTRFSATGKNTYEIVDRRGNNDTNIYDEGDLFDIDTSLYKRILLIPKLEFKGVLAGGNLKVGNYHFYFKFSDADGNETDFIAESGLVSVFIGFDYPLSVTTGLANENSTKLVRFKLSNIDDAYNYVTVYYSRNTAETNSLLECAKINKKYIVNNANVANIVITGFEDIIEIPNSDINLQYNIVDAVGTSTTCLNMLFMANVHKPDIPYEELTLLALRFRPYLKEELYPLDMDYLYTINSTAKGYYDPKYIYEKTGYWGNELYRFGIVFIMPNNELTPVFNIRGGCGIQPWTEADSLYTKFKLWNDNLTEYIKIQVKEDTNYILTEGNESRGDCRYENAKGVVSFNPTTDTNKVYGIDIKTDKEVIDELKKYVKGYFFVRQKRIPTILALGITIGIDNESRTPTIPTAGGLLTEMANKLNESYVETEDIGGINFISEGFLTRYYFKLVSKKSSLWSTIGKVVGLTVAMAAAVVGTLVTAGGMSIAVAGLTTLIVGGATAATMTAVAGILLIVYNNSEKVPLKGRSTPIPNGKEREELDNSRIVGGEFRDRAIIKDLSYNKVEGILCPDYEVNQAYYNQIFTGNKHVVKSTLSLGINLLTLFGMNYFSNNRRHFYIPSYYDTRLNRIRECKIVGVPDNVKCVGIGEKIYRSRAGEAEEVWRYENVGRNYTVLDDIKINSDIIRGSYGPYLAVDGYSYNPAETVEILIPGYDGNAIEEYILVRMDDKSSYYAISDRITTSDQKDYLTDKISFNTQDGSNEGSNYYTYTLYRGDCYLCQYTHRVFRNFNDPSAPYNDKIISENTWKENYDPSKPEKYSEINLGDVNAVELGMWATFRVRSSYNLNIRTLDKSNVDEDAMTGHPRGYYPYYPMNTEGIYKTPEAQIYNKGFITSTSERWNFELPNVPHIKNWFGTRIMYSDIHVNDAYKNGFRVFLGSNYRDYTREYGEIVKLVSFESSLLCVFEHGIALIPVNERAVAGEGMGGNVFINTSNVLPENPLIISDMFGSLWPESVLKVPGKTGDAKQYVYGVDTVAKKIWRTDGLTLLCISDFKVQEFLNNNITLGERELTSKIGIRNVKTVYNAFKRDVMFTFYDNTYGFEEKVWNLCWNELLEKFITFYSWVPSYMENINNIPFSFDRTTSKWIAKLATSHVENSFADGITLSNVVLDNFGVVEGSTELEVSDFKYTLSYEKHNKATGIITATMEEDRGFICSVDCNNLLNNPRHKFIGYLSLSDRILPNSNYNITYELVRDNYSNYKMFDIKKIAEIILPSDALYAGQTRDVYGLYFKDHSKELLTPVYSQSLEDLNKLIHMYGSNTPEKELTPDFQIFMESVNYEPRELLSELYYRNALGNAYADYDVNKIGPYTKESYIEFEPGDTYLLWCGDRFIYEELLIELQKLAGTSEDALIWLNSIPIANARYWGYYDNFVNYTFINPLNGTTPLSTLYYPEYNTNEELEPIWKEVTTLSGIMSKEEFLNYLKYILDDHYHLRKFYITTNESDTYFIILPVWQYLPGICTSVGAIEYLYNRNRNGSGYEDSTYTGEYLSFDTGLVTTDMDPEVHGIPLTWHWMLVTLPDKLLELIDNDYRIHLDKPIFKDVTGKRLMLPKEELLNPDRLVTLLNIRANISMLEEGTSSVNDAFFNLKAGYNLNTQLVNVGLYESVIALTPKWNLQFLTNDFWKHGQSGIIDITDDIYPTYWYGKQHPFEFECMVVNDPSVHKIFTNLELVANKAKPESFHYEIVGESYDFAKDKPNMYFRQEAMKALWQYNGADISYNRNFLKILPRLLNKSADLIKTYYQRLDTINEVEDYYVHCQKAEDIKHDYRHLSGAEIVYYPNRQEFRIWNHNLAISLDDLSQDTSRSIIAANCKYIEDRWRININPINVCYKNEYRKFYPELNLFHKNNSIWAKANNSSLLLPTLPIYNSPIPTQVIAKEDISFPGADLTNPETGKDNALYNLYDLSYYLKDNIINNTEIFDYRPLDTTNWLNDSSIYKTSFGEAQNRKEIDLKDKFLKVRIRYSGEELAIIDCLKTIYQISYA